MSDIKNKKVRDVEFDEEILKARKRRNNINRFLMSYFKYFLVVIIFIILVLSFKFLLIPQYKEVVFASNNVLKEKKTEFMLQYQELKNYENTINQFNTINSNDIYRIEKMIPNSYSRDDLFAEITYFLMTNNYKVENVEVLSLDQAPTSTDSNINLNRRSDSQNQKTTTSSSSDLYKKQLSLLPENIGAWKIRVSVSEVDYFSLKKMLNILESNLKIIDIYYLDFKPTDRTVSIDFLTYYKK
jgi:hypothetical protein